MKHAPSPASASAAAARPAPRPRSRSTGTAARSAAAPQPATSREVLVRMAAYALYEARGCTDGHALDDWVEAELQVDRAGRH